MSPDSDRKLAFEETNEFFEHAVIGMARVCANTARFTLVNDALCEMLGYTSEEILELCFADVTHPEDLKGSWEQVRSALAGSTTSFSFEKRYLTKKGAVIYALVSTTLVRDEANLPCYFLTQIIDVGEQRRRRMILEAHNHVLEMAARRESLDTVLHEIVRYAEELSPDVRASIQLVAPDGKHLIHAAAPSLPADYRSQIEGLEIRVGVGSCGTAAATGRRFVAEDITTHPYWREFREPASTAGFRACWSEPILDAGGGVLGTFALYYGDVRSPGAADLEYTRSTARLAGIAIARRRAEDELERSEAHLRITLNSIGDAVITTDTSGNIERLNRRAEELTGWSSPDAHGQPLAEVYAPVSADTSEPVEDLVDSALRRGEVFRRTAASAFADRHGRTRYVSDNAAPIRDPSGLVVGAVLVFRDMSEERDLQEQLKHSQKMEAIGQLAGGIAHDFNNVLSAILGSAELLRNGLDDDEHHERGLVEQVIKASKHATHLTQQLLAFSRKAPMRTEFVDLHRVLEELATLLGRIIDKRIEIQLETGARYSMVAGDPSQLQNALLNLGVNARDAMPRGGRLSIRTRNVTLEVNQSEPIGVAPGEYVEVSLVDTGCGMSPETLEHIFEPFFTTKETGQGTGLGLAGVYGTVQSHGGSISAESTLGTGSSFRLLLPVATKLEMQRNPRAPGITPVSRQQSILVVDDEELVRDFTAKALQREGFTVTTCEDGVEAVRLFRDDPARFDVVLLDMVMPRMNGLDTFRLMRALNPDVLVVIASGFSQDRQVEMMLNEGAREFLKKPFHLEELLAAIGKASASPT